MDSSLIKFASIKVSIESNSLNEQNSFLKVTLEWIIQWVIPNYNKAVD